METLHWLEPHITSLLLNFIVSKRHIKNKLESNKFVFEELKKEIVQFHHEIHDSLSLEQIYFKICKSERKYNIFFYQLYYNNTYEIIKSVTLVTSPWRRPLLQKLVVA